MLKVALTGDRPTGKLHLGHYLGSLKSRLELQKTHKQYILIADMQALTDNFHLAEKVASNVLEVLLDYLAVGICSKKSTICLQSGIPALGELGWLLMNLTNVASLERNPTVKEEAKQKYPQGNMPAGFLCYPISQAADITAFQADVVPVGIDQLPMIELSNEIVRKFHRIYGNGCLKEVEAKLSKVSKLPGIDGNRKMSKSLGNAIYLSDENAAIMQKVNSMFTDPDHIKATDKGKVEGNTVFAYLDAFYDDAPHLTELKAHYQRGGLGDSVIKGILSKTLIEIIEPIREARNALNKKDAIEALQEGTKAASKAAKFTLELVKERMGICQLWAP
jgi:tryptophanyl-tRNA synthetase